jgi:hypothetical protein
VAPGSTQCRASAGSHRLAEFVAQIDGINALADATPGFVWRLTGTSGNSTDVRADDPSLIVNRSVWESPEALFDFVYKSPHVKVMARRREWFERMEVFTVLWWVPTGHRPTVEEAMHGLRTLREHGPSPETFTFKQRYPMPEEAGEPTDMKTEPYCVA